MGHPALSFAGITLVAGVLYLGEHLTMSLAYADQAPGGDTAIIKNSPQTSGMMPMELTLTSVDGQPVDVNKGETRVSPGEHDLEVLCVTRQQAGMGQAMQRNKTRLKLKAERGQTYQLEGRLDAKEKCIAQLAGAN